MPKVSVIVPVYNVEKYIGKCLDSLVSQTLQDIEIIIVNDGSKDESERIIEQYRSKYADKITYVKKENGGLSDARNYGMKYATGDYIAFLDSDDYVDVTIYEKLYNKAIDENCDYVECGFIWKYEDHEDRDYDRDYRDKYELLAYANVVAWNKLIKRDLLEEVGVEFPKGLRYEDVEFFYKLVPYIKKIGVVKECLINYVQRNNSIIKTQNERTGEIFIVTDNVIKFYKENGFYNEYKEALEYAYSRILLCSSFFRIVKIHDGKVRKKLLNLTWKKIKENFPNWKKNKYLREGITKKKIYMRTINSITFKCYSILFK